MRISTPHRRSRLARLTRILVGAAVFAGGLLASGVFSTAVPAEDCTPLPLGCPTTVLPPAPPLPSVTVPTLPTLTETTTTTTATGATAPSDPAAATTTTTTPPTGASKQSRTAPRAALTVKTSVRVRGRGVRRVVELRVRLTDDASATALLRRSGSVLARRQVQLRAGTSVVVLRIVRGAKPGLATLSVTFRAGSGKTARTTHRVRVPR